MKITNNYGYPDIVVAAAKNDPYDAHGRLSVTGLLSPPQQKRLEKVHQDDLETDVSDLTWAMFGQALHTMLERAVTGEEAERYILEKRLTASYNGVEITGAMDCIDLDTSTLTDWKTGSVWEIIFGVRPEREMQLNVYAWMCRKAGIVVNSIQNVFFLRDWSAGEAERKEDYPKRPIVVVEQDLWDDARVEALLAERIALHTAADPAPCTREDQWAKDDVWAHMREGRKSAVKLYKAEEEAQEAVEGDPKGFVEHRPGERIRCSRYCAVARWCPQYAAEMARQEDA